VAGRHGALLPACSGRLGAEDLLLKRGKQAGLMYIGGGIIVLILVIVFVIWLVRH
jgi:hypothetical protein